MKPLVDAALDLQVDMLRWATTEFGKLLLDALERQQPRGEDEESSIMHSATVTALNGDTFAVAEDIVDLLESAAPSIPDYPLHLSDLPTPFGFIYFERSVITTDSHEQPIAVRAMAWGQTVQIDEGRPGRIVSSEELDPAAVTGIVIMLFTDPSDPQDSMSADWEEFRGADWEKFQLQIGRFGRIPPLMPMWGGIWETGQAPQYHDAKILCAFFRFIQETYVDHRMISGSRAATRRAARVCPDFGDVRVIQLRKTERRSHRPPEGHQPQEVEWSHRWIVKGFWRNQWYPTEKRHAPKWIKSYVKGPDDKPLIVKDRVFDVSR